MEEVILIKLGEIVLKGLNRKVFEQALLKSIHRRISPNNEFDIHSAQSTIYIRPKSPEADLDDAEEKAGKLFGVIAYSRACVAEKEIGAMQKAAAQYLENELLSASTFKVESKRSDKKFPLNSMEVAAQVGGYLLSKFPHLSVDVHEPELVVHVEVREDAAYIHGAPRPGAGGLPVGTAGKAAVLISGGIDSPVAAWMMARRGLELTGIHFASPPYTSERAELKVKQLLGKVAEYSGRIRMYTVGITKIQEEIRDKCPEELFTVIMRRFMMRAAAKLAEKEECGALITGESLGQVASQTLQAIACTDAVANMPVFRPLIGTDKAEIIKTAHRIDTFDISIEPYEDCCTVFTPKHPRTRPSLKYVEEAEAALDVEGLVEDCLKDLRWTMIYPSRA